MSSYRSFSYLNSNVKFQDPIDASKLLGLDLSNITGTKTITIPDANLTMVGTSISQTLINKTIDADNNTISNIDNNDIKIGAGIDASKIADGSVSNTEFQYLSNLGSAAVGESDTQTLTNKTFTDSTTYFQDEADNTKKLQLQLSGITTTTTRTLIVPDANTTLVGTDSTQTLSGKIWGDNLNMNSNRITNLAEPVGSNDAVTKNYVDNVATGLDIKDSVVVASTVDLDSNSSISGSIDYQETDGSSSRGQITATLSTTDTFTIDGVNFGSAQDGSRILLKNQSSAEQNGIWITTVSGTSLTLDRSTDFDDDNEVSAGAFVFIEQGSVNADSGWVLATDNPIVIGGSSGTPLSFVQFSGAGTINAGTGLTKSGSTINVGGSSTIIANADDIEVNSSSTANQVLLSSGSVGTVATYGSLPLDNSNSVSGVLGINNGGTNTSSFSAGSRIVATNSGNTALEDTNLVVSEVMTHKTDSTQTTDAGITDLSIIATSNNSTYLLDATIVADNVGANESCGFSIKALFRNDGDTLVMVADDILEIKDTGIIWSASVTTNSTNIVIQIIGETGKTINWKSAYSTLTV